MQENRFRLTRCGVLNVWQYDRQVFDFADGRLLLRGANGAGKSKTMEMLLPFAIDGDKTRLTASGRHHTSLLWLMLDGHEGQGRTGYVWVEFTRRTAERETETVTCGVGMRATQSARTATAWFFTSPRRVGYDLQLEDESGPLSQPRLKAEVENDGRGRFFEQAARYREHVGQVLFGLPADQYDELLRLIYWLRQPQVGEDIDPKRLAEQLVNALPQVDDTAVRAAGDTFDELESFGERIERRARAAAAVGEFVETYAAYARAVLADRGRMLVEADARVRSLTSALRRTERSLGETRERLDRVNEQRDQSERAEAGARDRITALESGPEARARQRLVEMGKTVAALGSVAQSAREHRDQAQTRAARSADRAERGAAELGSAAATLAVDVHESATEAGALRLDVAAAALADLSPLGETGTRLRWSDQQTPADVEQVLGAVVAWTAGVQRSAGERQAALRVVREALVTARAARVQADDATRHEEVAQSAADDARRLVQEATEQSHAAEATLTGDLSAWLAAPDAVAFTLPELDADGLGSLDALARAAVSMPQGELNATAGQARAAIRTLTARRDELVSEQTRIEVETDPVPPGPAWQRSPRQGLTGAPFWKLVDFRDDLEPQERAGLEAALEAAGLLDAWVSPDGSLAADDRWDSFLLRPGMHPLPGDRPAPAGRVTLTDVLRVDVGAGAAGIPGELVESLLAAIALGEAIANRDVDERPAAMVGLDGSWRIGQLAGRTTKPVAQYLGASARAAERQRRLDALAAQIAQIDTGLTAAGEELRRAEDRLQRLGAWLDARPRHDHVLRAWATQDAREQSLREREHELIAAATLARERRAEAAARHTALEEVATAHQLPTTDEALAVLADRLRQLTGRLQAHERAASDRLRELARWREDARAARDEAGSLVEASRALSAADEQWEQARSEHDELLRAEGASVEQLEARLAELRRERDAAARRRAELDRERDDLMAGLGSLHTRLTADQEQLQEAQPQLALARGRFAGLADLPGVVAAALPFVRAEDKPAGGDADRDGDPAVPGLRPADLAALDAASVRRLVADLAVPPEALARNTNAVLQSVAALQSGDAAVNEPRVLEQDGALVAVGRDESGELPVVTLARRLSSSVARDRELLSDRERKLFEDHILGQLGDALRGVRIKAGELVQAMNDQLHDVTTSQGIRVRLRWRLRDDIPPEARRAVRLLAEPLGALLPEERTELRESLHRLIETSRTESPEEPYAVHLARALDYRRWHAFTVQYHRPETGEWRDLQRRTALSQGEQKVLCYLPLFAAAAAHFASVAGAAPHAPRFVLLDDAFPKIDVRTHPLLFGLLVDLDLDFVITSERLWGTHPTVPQLAIYEALRSPHDRGIAQYEHRWDGHQLTSVGA